MSNKNIEFLTVDLRSKIIDSGTQFPITRKIEKFFYN